MSGSPTQTTKAGPGGRIMLPGRLTCAPHFPTSTMWANTKGWLRFAAAASPRSSRWRHHWPRMGRRTSCSPGSGRPDSHGTVADGAADMPLNVPHYTKLGGRQALGGALTDWQPIGRAIEPAEIGQSVAFLLSDASRAITGTSFVIDAA